MKVVFGTAVFARGHGVALVILELSRRLRQLDPQLVPIVLSLQADNDFRVKAADAGIKVKVCTAAEAPDALAEMRPSIFIPHTDPFFHLGLESFPSILYEHGDPCPPLFGSDAIERRRQIYGKQANHYHQAARVVAISRFQRMDLPWPEAVVIYNGCNHVPDLGPKPASSFADSMQFRVGILSRLGGGEAHYKGLDILLQMLPDLQHSIPGLALEYCGKISPEMQGVLRSSGITVHSAVSDEARNAWLRHCDVVFSPSLWEGFNLPLVEAQALGTLAVAFDTGAHPEATPIVCSGVKEVEGLLVALHHDRTLLCKHSETGYRFVRSHFDWDRSARDLLKLIRQLGVTGQAPFRAAPAAKRSAWRRRLWVSPIRSLISGSIP